MFELKVTLDNLLTFAGLLFVAWQMRETNKQSKLESQIRLYDINRDLISLGFSKPELFKILQDEKGVDATLQRRYLQVWLNQLCLVDTFKRSGEFTKDVGESFDTDLRDMMLLENMRHHWQAYGKYYPASFQESINDILHEAGHGLTTGKAKRSRRGARFFRKRRGASSRSLRP